MGKRNRIIIKTCFAIFIILCTAGCNHDIDEANINVPDSTTAWTLFWAWGGLPGKNSKTGIWSIKDAGTTKATLVTPNVISTMAPGTLTLTVTFKGAGKGGKDIVEDFTIEVDPAPPEIHALGTELVSHNVNTVDNPITLKANIDLEAYWWKLLEMLIVANRYVNLDLKDCTGTKIGGMITISFNLWKMEKLLSIVLPDSINSIEDRAFYNCTGLTSIVIPDSVTFIGYKAFDGCSSLASVTIGNNVESIGDSAFSDCTSLTGITIPGSVTSISIEDWSFTGCNRLKEINVLSDNIAYSSIDGILYDKDLRILARYPNGRTGEFVILDSVTSIGNAAFRNCGNLTSVTIPDSVTSIGNEAFKNCANLAKVTIGDSVTTIGDEAFYLCKNIADITIPNSVTTIGRETFRYCHSLESAIIGNNIAAIKYWAFFDCAKLTSVTFVSGDTIIDAPYSFPDDLYAKYISEGYGTYTRQQDETVWTKQ